MSEAQQEKPADAWGQPISEERQAELQGYLDRWAAAESGHIGTRGPFDGMCLTGADVRWLATQSGRDEPGWQMPNMGVFWWDGMPANQKRSLVPKPHLQRAALHARYDVAARRGAA